jgi:hypothetical protein
VDTVEWGTGSAPERTRGSLERPASRRLLTAVGGRWTVLALATLAFIALIGSELMPWTTLHTGGGGTVDTGSDAVSLDAVGGSYGLDRLNTIGVFAYQFGILAVLGLVGGALFARAAQRRALFGIALGLIAAQALNLAGLIHSFAHLLDNGVPASRLPEGYHTSVEPGAYLAVAGLILLLAALVLSSAPERVRSRLVDAVREPVDSQYTDEPFELTVTQAKPIDESYFTRPDPYIR